jgi:hypothetical protein
MKKKTALLIIFVLILAPLSIKGLASKVDAAAITTVTVTPSSTTASAANVSYVITFTPNTAITTGSIIQVNYDTAITGGASLTNADVAITGTNITSSAESGFAAGYFTSTLTISGSVTTTVTITIGDGAGGGLNDLTNPAAGNYGWGVTIDIGGTGSTYDSGAGLGYISNESKVTVTATVLPLIDMELYVQNSDTLLSNPNTCALGVLGISAVSSCVYDIGFATNITAGMTVKVVRDAALDSGANDINAVGDADVTAGSEEYGFSITDSGTGCGTVTSSYASGSVEYVVPSAVTTFFSTNATCNGTTTGQSTKRAEVTHKAAIDGQTAPGVYDQLVTYTAFTN